MHQDEIEVSLTSSEPAVDYDAEVSLRITAYFRDDGTFDGNTLVFHCDPIGTNYRTSFLKITFDDWSKVVGIRDFLAECFADDITSRRTLSVEVEDGVSSITPFNEPPNERTGLEEITIQVENDRIEFYRSGSVYPYIFTYEEKIDGVPQDRNNAEKLLNFFDEIISLHPDFDLEGDDLENPEVGPLFNQYRVESLLTELVSTDDDLYSDYQKAVREFEDGEYADSIRDLGRAAEILVEVICLDVYDEDNLPDKVARRLNKLDKSTDGLPSFIGKTISPLWWLRNKVAHANTYEPTEEDALYALLCFQMAVEKLIDEHIDN
ncbi:hypothetical protein [Halobellus sp. EA9]|uniref:hypothetical protein n=1 Tax=Halobellus sp. EA9 TaxID=3421647 RepID=UPI003EBC2C5F